MKILLFRSCSVEQLFLIIQKLNSKYKDLSIDLVLQKSAFLIKDSYDFDNVFFTSDGKFNFFKQGLSLLKKIKFSKYDLVIIPYNKYNRTAYIHFHLISLFIRAQKIKIFTFDAKEQIFSKIGLLLKEIQEVFLFQGVILSYFVFSFIKYFFIFLGRFRNMKKNNKIVYITSEGIYRPSPRIRCYNFAKALKEKKLKTDVISCPDDFGAKRENSLFKIWILNIKILVRLFKVQPFYIVVQKPNYHFFSCVLYKILFNAKLIFDTDDWDFDWPVVSSFEQKTIFNKLNKYIDIIFTASNYLYQEFKKYNKPIHLIPTVVDSDIFTSFLQKKEDKITISWIGGVTSFPMVDNLKKMISIFLNLKSNNHSNSNVKKICFEIVSYKGYLVEHLEEYINKLDDSDICLKQGLDADKIPAYLNNIDIGLVPLLHNTVFNKSKSPTKLFEYMSCGIPVVASRIGEAEHVISDGVDGFLAQDLIEFENKLEQLINDKSLREKMGRNARGKIENKYCLNVAADSMYKILG